MAAKSFRSTPRKNTRCRSRRSTSARALRRRRRERRDQAAPTSSKASAFAYGTNERLGADVPFVRRRATRKNNSASLGGPIVQDRLLFFRRIGVSAADDSGDRSLCRPGPRRANRASGPRGGHLALSSSCSWRVGSTAARRRRQQCRSVIGGVPSPGRAVVSLEQPITSVPATRMGQFDLRATDGSRTDQLSADRMLPAVVASAFAVGRQAVGGHPVDLQLRERRVQRVSRLGYTDSFRAFVLSVEEPLVLVTVPGTDGAPRSCNRARTRSRRASETPAGRRSSPTISRSPRAGTGSPTVSPHNCSTCGLFSSAAPTACGNSRASTRCKRGSRRDTASREIREASPQPTGGYGAAYLSDEWDVSSRLSLTLGLRADLSLVSAPSVRDRRRFGLHLRTDAFPRATSCCRRGSASLRPDDCRRAHAVAGRRRAFHRASADFWLFGGFSAYGLATRTLQCGTLSGDAGPAPAFNPDYHNPPMACAGGQTFGTTTTGEIDVIDPHLRLPQSTAHIARAGRRASTRSRRNDRRAVHARHERDPLLGASISRADGHRSRRRLMYGAINANGSASPSRVASQFTDIVSVGGPIEGLLVRRHWRVAEAGADCRCRRIALLRPYARRAESANRQRASHRQLALRAPAPADRTI